MAADITLSSPASPPHSLARRRESLQGYLLVDGEDNRIDVGLIHLSTYQQAHCPVILDQPGHACCRHAGALVGNSGVPGCNNTRYSAAAIRCRW